jgi:hypothetical protein
LLRRPASSSVTSDSSAVRLNSVSSSVSLPASILEKSRMLLIRAISVREEFQATSTNSCWRCVRRVSFSMSSMPTTPLSGVRTSWLTVAANCAFICAMLTAAASLFQHIHHLVEGLAHFDQVARAGRRGAHAGFAGFRAAHQARQRVQRRQHVARQQARQHQQDHGKRQRQAEIPQQQGPGQVLSVALDSCTCT